jgi:cytochrome d ubiquinol oxidase subunit I
MKEERTKYAIEIPYLGSLILTHSWTNKFRRSRNFPPEDRPNSTIVFWSFRIMAGLGMLMIAVRPVERLAALAWRVVHNKWFLRRCGHGAVRPDRDSRRLVHH